MATKSNKILFIYFFVLFILSLTVLNSIDPKEKIKKIILISAASSLTNAMENIITDFRHLHPDITVNISFGGSGYLVTQIKNGAPVDILISADERDADKLIREKLSRSEARFTLCRNILVLAGFQDYQQKWSSNNLRNFLSINDKIGIGNPDYVAAGLYTKRLLQKEELFSDFSTKFIQGNSARQVMGWLESKNVDLAFIYKTDVLLNQNIIIHREYPVIGDTEISYPAILTIKGESTPGAELFYTFLKSDKSRKILTDFGFMTENINGPANQS